MRKYRDSRGWIYAVQSGIGPDAFKARYSKPGKTSGKCVAKLPWRTTREEAQADLDAYARKGGRLYEIYERYVTCRMPAGIDAAASG